MPHNGDYGNLLERRSVEAQLRLVPATQAMISGAARSVRGAARRAETAVVGNRERDDWIAALFQGTVLPYRPGGRVGQDGGRQSRGKSARRSICPPHQVPANELLPELRSTA